MRRIVVGRVAALLLAGIACFDASPVAAQSVETAVRVLADTVTVGDSIRAVVRIRLPAGASAEWEGVAPYDSTVVQLLAPPQVLPAAPAEGRPDALAVVHAVAWRTGTLPVLTGRIRVTGSDGASTVVPVSLALPHVRTVLPADTAGVKPKGPKDVLGPSYDGRRVAILVAAALLVLLLLFLLVRALVRRIRRGPTPDPRRDALRELDVLRAEKDADAGEFHARLAATLRTYVAARWPRWGTELTTTELLVRMAEDGVAGDAVRPLADALTAADLAKFARIHPTREDAARHLTEARAWVAGFEFVEPERASSSEDGEVDAHAAEVAR